MACILTADDSASVRALVSATLERVGHDVVSAIDGREALDWARQDRAQLVITDFNMPEMDGLTLTRELRRLRRYEFTPILILTTETRREHKDAARLAGATGWLTKPFHPERLLSVVARCLD